MKLKIFIAILLPLLTAGVRTAAAQTDDSFDVSFIVDYSAAEQLVDYFDWKNSNTEEIASLPGNRLASATSVMLARTSRSDADFIQALSAARGSNQIQNDLYGLLPVKKHIAELRKLIEEAKKHRLEARVISTLEAYFPTNIKISAAIPVYLVVLGNDRAAAVVRRVVWHGAVPEFVGENEGGPVIIVNLTRVVEIELNVQMQFTELLATLAHESFHAVYSVLRQSLPDSTKPHTASEQLLDIVQNEGMAYYLSMEVHRMGRPLSRMWFNETAAAIDQVNHALEELTSPLLTRSRATELLMNANLSGTFKGNYGATAGMRMAYEIDTRLGRPALTGTLLEGPHAFVKLYERAAKQDATLPQAMDRSRNQ